MSGLALVDQLLRDRGAVHDRIDRGDRLLALARTMIAAIAAAAGLFGAAVGTYRGGVQIGYAAIKLPAVLLATAALCAPTLTLLELATGGRAAPARDLARILTALAFGALVLVAEAPLILCARAIEVGYHRTALLLVGCFAIAGAASVGVLARGVAGRAALWTTIAAYVLVGGQVSWTLRPYLVQPRSEEVVFVRDLDGSLYDAVVGSARAVRGGRE